MGAGGFYSDSKAFVSDECKKCPVGTFVPLSKWPGIRPEDCEACPQGIETLLAILGLHHSLFSKQIVRSLSVGPSLVMITAEGKCSIFERVTLLVLETIQKRGGRDCDDNGI